MQEIKLWNIEGKTVNQILQSKLDYENRLEKWLIEDISILSNSLAVIGSQVITAYNNKIDILAVNSVGEIIIIELKRDKTYREIVAQSLDYATWVKDLNYDELNGVFNKYGRSQYNDLGEYFSSIFKKDSEEIDFNSDHKILIVGSEIDDSTVRIIDYLSGEPYSVNINAVNFNYFKDTNGREFLAQSFIKPEESIVEESKSKKRKRAKSIVSQLFDSQKLKIGQKVFFKPALDNKIEKRLVEAEIVNTNQSCLKINGSNELFAFSKLRYIWAEKFNLNEVRKDWGFGVRFDWIEENGKSLSDLLEE
ncbi:hypothetical protein [Flexithrix dorotheae]|uniref:hypothetical protein n=1 Tax=Flexithrix dorotheae TaxID=70993 RepID=UPI00037A536C|nr:hypothetical protein [Flexithrix dorotheae]